MRAARATEVALARALAKAPQAEAAGRWARFLAPLPDRLRDAPLPELRGAARRVRAAFGPKDSIRDVLPGEVTEPLLEAVDRLLRVLDRRDAAGGTRER